MTAVATIPDRGPFTLPLLSKGYFNFQDPSQSVYGIKDIAVGLSKQLRFAGQTYRPYSVAQHSVLLSRIVPKEMAAFAMLHDGPEFVMCDLVKPLKGLLFGYQQLEQKVLEDMFQRFGLAWPMPAEIHESDRELARLESRHLRPWLYEEPPPGGLGFFHGALYGEPWWSTEIAVAEYLHRWEEVRAAS